MKKSRTVLALTLGTTLAFSATGFHSASANTYEQYQQQYQQSKQQLQQLKNKKSEALEKVQQLEKDISQTIAKYQDTQQEINETYDKIDALNKKIRQTQQRIERRQELLNKRVRKMYVNGGVIQYLQVLFSAQNFQDLLDRVIALNLITQQDKQLLQAQQEDKQQLKKAQQKTVEQLDALQEQLESVANMKQQLKHKVQKQKELIASLENKGVSLKQQMKAAKRAMRMFEPQVHTVSNKKETTSPQSNKSNQQSSHNTSNQQSGDKKDSQQKQSSSQPTVNVGNSAQVVSQILAMSRQFFGSGSYYAFGGQNAATGAFDCSGYVQWVYRQLGVSLPRTTGAMASVGTRVSKANLQPGDLVFFNTYKTNGHVGIYIGNGHFIGSQSGTGVAIVNLNSPYYWGPRFNHGQRILP